MRITNKMMSNNSMANINADKSYLDRLNTQMAAQKKITRPSDDPIIAIRALRLRSSLSEVSQYYGANVPDAKAWVDVTQGAIDSTMGMLSTMRSLCDQAANGTNTTSEREKIYQTLEAYKSQIYSNGNVTNAGRSVFTGYRTGEKLTFTADTEADYRGIADRFNASDVEKAMYAESPITMDSISSMTENVETEVKEDRVNRIRLSYDDLNKVVKKGQTAGWSGAERAGISGWSSSSELADYFNDDGSLNSAGESTTIDISTVAGDISVRFREPYDQSLVVVTDSPMAGEYIFWPENSSYGGLDISGKVFGTVVKDTTTLVYRTELSGKPVISQNSVTMDPVDGIQSFEIDHAGTKYLIEKFADEDRWFAVDGGSGSPIETICVTQNTDKSFKIVCSTDGRTFDYEDGDCDVFNVSANGQAVTSCYHQCALEVKITDSVSQVATDGSGKGLTAYQYLALNDKDENADDVSKKAIYLLADTGELVFGSDVAATLSSLKDIPGVDTISVTYDKKRFKEGDLRPEHYFDTWRMDEKHDTLLNRMIYDSFDQGMYYTVGTNQNIRINTNAGDVFDPQIVRELDDILRSVENYNAAEEKVSRLSKLAEEDGSTKVKDLLAAAQKELSISKEILQGRYESAISAFSAFYDKCNLANTNCGTIDSRLTLISNRLSDEKSTVTTLASENENVDITDIAIEASEAELIYNAALMSTGKINQRSLMDYI